MSPEGPYQFRVDGLGFIEEMTYHKIARFQSTLDPIFRVLGCQKSVVEAI